MARNLILLLPRLASRANRSQLPCRTLPYTTYQTLPSINTISSNPAFAFLGHCEDVYSLKKIHALLIVNGLTGGRLSDTKLVSLYGSFGHVGDARLVFDKIPEPDFYSWKVLIRWYLSDHIYRDVVWLYTRMRMCVIECDNIVFSIVLKACSELRDIVEGRKVHCQIVKFGNPDSFVRTGLIDMYAKCGEIEHSHAVFAEVDERNVMSWTAMISGYVRNGCAKKGLTLFNRMRDAIVEGNQYTLVIVANACAKLGALHQGKWTHGYVIKKGFELGSHMVTTFLDMYVKCGSIQDARSVFDEISIDIASWTAMIVGYTQSGYPEEAIKLFMDKKWIGISPDGFAVASIVSACGQIGNISLGRMVHGLGIKLGFDDLTISNALVDMYAKCRTMKDAGHVFWSISDKDLISWNSIISGYCQNGYSFEALVLFKKMRSESISPDAVTFVSALSACAALGALDLGCSIHAYSVKEGLESSNVYLGTAIVNFYAKCGVADSARIVFEGMKEKNAVTWSAMIGGYGMQGDSHESLSLFSHMVNDNMEPNESIFTTILSACSHAGMIMEGLHCFNRMCQDYNFVPSMKHYTCMVDLLARAGRLEEALDFIEKLPVEPDVSLFGAFLHGCAMYSRFDLGVVAISRMVELNPDSACYYVLISNLFASDGRWTRVTDLRELMKQRELRKLPGYSHVKMDMDGELSSSRVACIA